MSSLQEVAFIFLSVMAVIWGGEVVPFPVWPIAIPSVFLILRYWKSVKSESFKDLWRPTGGGNHYILLVVAFLIFWTSTLLISMKWNPDFWAGASIFKKFTISILFYYPNALWQQILVNGYFYPRLKEGLKSDWKALLVLGLLFGLTHIPNPVLIPVTMIGGTLSAYFFKRTKNIYALVVTHSILAVSIMYFLPHSWHHHLRVGPEYFRCL